MDNNDYIEFEGVRRYQPDALHYRMAKRIAELETHLAQTEAILQNTQAMRDQAFAERAAALEQVKALQAAQQWQPIACTYADAGGVVELAQDQNSLVFKFNGKTLTIFPDDVRICCKIQPAE